MFLMDVVGHRSAVAVLNPLFLESKGGGHDASYPRILPPRAWRSLFSVKEIRQIDTESSAKGGSYAKHR